MVKLGEIKEDLSQMSGLFWGVAMQGGKRYSQKVVTPFHISMAALEPGSAGDEDVGNGYVTVWLGIKGFDYLLCTLKHDSVYNFALDYEFDVGEELDLFINGKGTVYLTGYLRVENDPPVDWQDYDEDGEAESVGSDENMFLDSGDEDDEDERSDESDDEIVPIRKRKKSNVKIVELEDSPKKPKKGEAPKPKAKEAEKPVPKEEKKNEKKKIAKDPPKVEVVEAPAASASAKKKKKKNKNKNKTLEESLGMAVSNSKESPAAKSDPASETSAAKSEPASVAVVGKSEPASEATAPVEEPTESITTDEEPKEKEKSDTLEGPDASAKASEKITEEAIIKEANNQPKDTQQQDAPMDTSASAEALAEAPAETAVDIGPKDIPQEVEKTNDADKIAVPELKAEEERAAPNLVVTEAKVKGDLVVKMSMEEDRAAAGVEADKGEETAAPVVEVAQDENKKVASVVEPATSVRAVAEVKPDEAIVDVGSSVADTKEKPVENGSEGGSLASAESKSAKKKKKKNKNKSLNESGIADISTTETSKDVNGNSSESKKRKSDSVSPAKNAETTPAKKNKQENAAGEKTITLPGGLVIHEQREGSGDVAKKGAVCMIKYTGRLKATNKVFDSNASPRESPLKMVVGKKEVIDGFDEGVEGMKVGGKRRLVIPPHKAYGKQSPSREIPPNSALIFDVELVKMVGKKK